MPSGQSYEGKNLQDQGGKVVHSYPQQYVNNIDETKLDGVEDYHPLLLKSQNSLPNPLNL